MMWNRKDSMQQDEERDFPYRSVDTAARVSHSDSGGEEQRGSAIIGPSILIKGELTGEEDLTIEGRVEGKIELRNFQLVIGEKGVIRAAIHARSVTILGEVMGNITADERAEIRASGRLKGDIVAPRVVIADGAFFKGSVDMEAAGSEPPVEEAGPLDEVISKVSL